MNIIEQFEAYKKETDKLLFEEESLKKQIEFNELQKEKLNNNISLYNESKNVLNSLILKTRTEAITFIETIVNGALEDVFTGRGLKLKLILNEGAKVSLSAYIEEDGQLFDIETSRGGGLRDLISVSILICCRKLCNIELPLILDESFKYLHSTKNNTYKKNAFMFLKNIAQKLDTQIILITGEEDIYALQAADNVISVKKGINGSYVG